MTMFLQEKFHLNSVLISINKLTLMLLFCSLIAPISANAGYAEEWMMGTIIGYNTACEEMSEQGVDNFSYYVEEHIGSIENMSASNTYQTAYNTFIEPITSEEWRVTVCSQFKKALIRKEFYYWIF